MPIAVSAVLLALALLAYRRQFRMTDGGMGLFLLRMLVLLVFAVILTAAVFTRVWRSHPRGVAVLIDHSASMAALGLDSSAVSAAHRLPLPPGAKPSFWTFADSVAKLPSEHATGVGTERTRLGHAIAAAARTKPGAIVVLSDGQDNGEEQPVTAAREAGVPVYTVGFGATLARNLSLTRVNAPAVAYSGDTVEIGVEVSAYGFPGGRARVTLQGQTREIVLGSDLASQEVRFRVATGRAGRLVLEARVDSLPGETNYADNARSRVVDVVPNRFRLAYITSHPGPGSRFLLRALRTDERLDVVTVTPEEASAPEVAGELARTDVFVLDDVAEQGKAAQLVQEAAERVRAGAGALVLAGPGLQVGVALGSLLPAGIESPRAGSFTPELAAAGRILPWFGAADVTDGADRVDIGRVPPFAGVRELRALGAGADVWLQSRESRGALVVASKAGRGKVVYVAGYPLWRWGFSTDQTTGSLSGLAAFLAATVRYLAESDTVRFQLDPAKPGFYSGEPVEFVLRARAFDGGPWRGLDVQLEVDSTHEDTSGTASVRVHPVGVRVPMSGGDGGIYQAILQGLRPGTYRARAEVSLQDSVLGVVATPFVVTGQSIEMASTGLNEPLLRAVAAACGGHYFAADSLPVDGSELKLGSYEKRFRLDPRRAGLAYVLVAALAGVEWFLRRRKGLL